MRRRKHCSQTIKNKQYQGKILEHGHQHHHKQSCIQLSSKEPYQVQHNYKNLSVFTVEDPRTSKVKDSEPVYQTIEEISRNFTQNIQGVGDRRKSEEKSCTKINIDYHNKR